MRIMLIAACIMAGGATLLGGCSGKSDGSKGSSTTTTVTSTSTASFAPATPKPGLWEMTASAAGMPAPMRTRVCIGAPAPGANPFTPPPQAGQSCGRNNVTRTASGYAIDVECTMNGVTMQTKGQVTGDLASSFKTETTTRMSGPNIPAALQSPHASTVEAHFVGACPAGVKPGMVSQAG